MISKENFSIETFSRINQLLLETLSPLRFAVALCPFDRFNQIKSCCSIKLWKFNHLIGIDRKLFHLQNQVIDRSTETATTSLIFFDISISSSTETRFTHRRKSLIQIQSGFSWDLREPMMKFKQFHTFSYRLENCFPVWTTEHVTATTLADFPANPSRFNFCCCF